VALRKAIQRTNEQFLEVAGRMRLNDGSTAVCVVLRGSTLTVSNVGDSRAVLISGRKGIALTEDHKPSTPSEQKRIASFGGTVTYNTGIARVAGVLAVSRAFGNYTIRNLIRADPDITERELTPQDDFIVLASDGLWDVFSANEVAEVCYSWHRFGVNRIAEQLVQLALTRGSMDNVTAVVVSLSKYISRLQHQQQQQQQQQQLTGRGMSASESASKQRASGIGSSRPDSGRNKGMGNGSLFAGAHSSLNSNYDGGGGGDDETLVGDGDENAFGSARRYQSSVPTESMSRFASSYQGNEGGDNYGSVTGEGMTVQSARSGHGSDRKLTIVSSTFPPTSDSSSFHPTKRSGIQQHQSSSGSGSHNFSSAPLHNHHGGNPNTTTTSAKKSGSYQGSSLPAANSGGASNPTMGNGSLFSKTLPKTDPPLERIYSPIIAPSSRKIPSRGRPNTSR
jgi:serine/threonine protein phosphatase PrpC